MRCSNYRKYIRWYTVYDAKTGEVVAAGNSRMCAEKLGYASAESFVGAVQRSKKEKYDVYIEDIKRNTK